MGFLNHRDCQAPPGHVSIGSVIRDVGINQDSAGEGLDSELAIAREGSATRLHLAETQKQTGSRNDS